MNKVEKIDDETILFCGYTYKKTTQQKVSSNDPEFWDLMDEIDNGNSIIFESDVYSKV